MAFLSSEVDAEIYIYAAEIISCGELRLGVVVGVNDGIGSEIPFGVVPDDTESPHAVEIEIAKGEVAEDEEVVVEVSHRMFVPE